MSGQRQDRLHPESRRIPRAGWHNERLWTSHADLLRELLELAQGDQRATVNLEREGEEAVSARREPRFRLACATQSVPCSRTRLSPKLATTSKSPPSALTSRRSVARRWSERRSILEISD